jgi:hypothetical protein
VTLSEFGYTNKTFVCLGWTFSESGSGGVNLTLREDDSSSYADLAVSGYSTVTPAGGIQQGFFGVPDPSGLSATAHVESIELDWTNPANMTGIIAIEVFASPNSSWSSAVKIGETIGTQFIHDESNGVDSIVEGNQRYYWVRARRFPSGEGSDAVSDRNPDSDTSTVQATKGALGALANLDTVGDAQIDDNAVGSDQIADNAVGSDQIANDAVGSDQIADDSVTADQIADGAVELTAFASGIQPVQVVSTLPASAAQGDMAFLTTDNNVYRYNGSAWTKAITLTEVTDSGALAALSNIDLSYVTDAGNLAALNTVGSSQIDDDAITNAKIAVDAIQGDVIAAGAITANKIGANAVTTAKIANDAITTALIAAEAITTTEIGPNAITTAKIAANAITASEIAANAVTANEIAANTITAGQIATGAITADEIAANAVTAAAIAANTITASEIAANAITATEIAAGTITASEIASDTITANQIAAGAIAADEIAAGAVTTAKLAAGAVTANEIASNTVTAAQIASNTITANEIASSTITANELAAGTITSNEIAANTITAGQIAAGAISTDELAANAVTAAKITAGTITFDKLLGGVIENTTDTLASSVSISPSDGVVTIDSVTRSAPSDTTLGHKPLIIVKMEWNIIGSSNWDDDGGDLPEVRFIVNDVSGASELGQIASFYYTHHSLNDTSVSYAKHTAEMIGFFNTAITAAKTFYIKGAVTNFDGQVSQDRITVTDCNVIVAGIR